MMKARLLLKNILKGILGIFSEIALVYIFIFIGFLTCLFWWWLLR